MEDHRAVVIGVQVVGWRRGTSRKQSHAHFGSGPVRRWSKCGIVGKASKLGFSDDSIVAEASAIEIVCLEISGGLVESESVVIVVGKVDEVKNIGNRRGWKRFRIGRCGAVTEGEIKYLSCAKGVAIYHRRVRCCIRLIVAILVEVRLHIVPGRGGAGCGKPAIGKRD